MGKPSAADVDTALCKATLHQTMKGTDRNPPPAPTSPDRKPIPAPAALVPTTPGIWRAGLGFLLRSMLQPE
ncbi:hypothetical protein G6F57_020954 [Rhizopus arrhizus]|nr:hypothetical protein G6F59_018979 [Rhizopus arrhizus]KAG1435807.1 hypothetical protein G6F57_020954 [Rhizopus arrhizus]